MTDSSAHPNRRQALAGIAAAMLLPTRASATPMLDPALPAWQPVSVPPPTGRYVLPDGRIRIVGTDIMRSLVEALNRRFVAAYPAFAFDLQMKPGLMAIGPAAYGVTPFAPMPRLFTRVEAAAFRATAGRDPIAIRVAHGSVVARDRTAAMAIYVHRDNPIAHLTIAQVAGIFSTGQPGGDIRTWGQLGLTGEWAERSIRPVGTPEDAGFGSYMVEERMGGMPLTPAMTVRAISTDVIKIVGSDVAAIGYAAINFADVATRQVAVGETGDGPWQLGTVQQVVADTYPLDRFVYLYAALGRDGMLEPWIAAYFRLALSREGQMCVAQEENSFLPLGSADAARERILLARALSDQRGRW